MKRSGKRPSGNSRLVPVPGGSPSRSTGKRLLFHAVTVVLFFGLIELVLAISGVRPILVEKDPYVGFASQLKLFELKGSGDTLRTSPNKLALFNDQTFPRRKASETFRIFTLGGSVTYGRPFEDATSFSGWLRSYLEKLVPDKPWQVINAGGISYASYRVATLMEELVDYEPDLFVIYSGHNEFLERRTYSGLIEEPEALTRTKLLLQRSRLWALGRKIVTLRESRARRKYELTGEVEELLESSAGLNYYFRDNAFKRQVLDHYRFNLRRMVRLARAGGAQVILVSVPVNEKDFAPFKSQHRDGIGVAERQRYAALLAEAAEAFEEWDGERARELASEAIEVDPLFAEGHYLLGKALHSLGFYDEAATSFARAIEEDVCPLRALAETKELIFEAARREAVPLVDFRSLLKHRMSELAGHRNLGDEFFLDHAHPTVEAHGILARALVQQMAAMGLLELTSDWYGRVGERVHREVLGRVDTEAHNNLGKVYFDLGELEEALSSYQRAIELRPSYLEAIVGRGLVLGELGSYREAVDAFSASSGMNPGAPDHEAQGYASRVAACRPGREVFGKVWPLGTAVRS